MSLINTARNATAASLLTLLAACTPSNDPKPNPQPTPELVVSNLSLKAQNLDNPGSTDYMTGDRVQYTATIDVVVKNPTTGMPTATIREFDYRFNPGQPAYDVYLQGNGVSNFNNVSVINAPNVASATPNTLAYQVIINDPTNNVTGIKQLNGNGDLMNLKPATNNNYLTATIGQNVLTNMTKVVNASKLFHSYPSGETLTDAQWTAFYNYGFDSDTSHAKIKSMDADYTLNMIRAYWTDNGVTVFQGPRSGVYTFEAAVTNKP